MQKLYILEMRSRRNNLKGWTAGVYSAKATANYAKVVEENKRPSYKGHIHTKKLNAISKDALNHWPHSL